ncbi:hypothetical protein PBI_HILLTOPFARM_106 [Mycobacterium phage Hilltopfarm]|nr:hypothetical protein PBI_HILLTOPFARM_106 [Mycobacterium phage Hilltopfarm]
MSTTDPHTHDRDACPDCAKLRKRWGPGDHCDRTHDFQTGQVVTIGAGTTPWTVAYTYGALVVVERPVKGRFSTKRRHLSFGDRQRRPITDLHVVTEVVTT